jgi:hypothetical protein
MVPPTKQRATAVVQLQLLTSTVGPEVVTSCELMYQGRPSWYPSAWSIEGKVASRVHHVQSADLVGVGEAMGTAGCVDGGEEGEDVAVKDALPDEPSCTISERGSEAMKSEKRDEE